MEKKTAVKENSQLLYSDVLKKTFNSLSSANHKTYFSATVVSVKPLAYSLVTNNKLAPKTSNILKGSFTSQKLGMISLPCK
jgi:hypothetical protein